MKSYRRSVGVMLVVGVAVALALVEYGSAGAITRGAQTRAVAVAAKKQETKKQKLAKALKACKKDKSKSKRKKCETAARKKYGSTKPHENRGTGTTGTGTGATTTTGTPTTTGTTGTTTGTTGTAGTTGTTTGTTGTTTGTTGTTTGTTGTTTTGGGGETVAQEIEKATHASEMPSSGLIAQGRGLFETDGCAGCHGIGGEGLGGDGNVPYAALPRAQTVTGVIDQLIEPDGGMPNYDKEITFEHKEELGDYICVDLVHKCEEAH